MLLNLTQSESGADSVDGSGGDEKGVAGSRVEPLEETFNLAGKRGFAQFLRSDRFAKAGSDLRAGLSLEHVPHFGFPAGMVMLPGVLVAGMDLDGEFFCGEEELDQQGKVVDAFKPDLADFLI